MIVSLIYFCDVSELMLAQLNNIGNETKYSERFGCELRIFLFETNQCFGFFIDSMITVDIYSYKGIKHPKLETKHI